MKNSTKSSVLFILITVFIDSIGFGIIIPIMPELIKQLTGATLSEASRYGGLLLVAYSIMVFLFSPILGALSDHFGRRPILLISLFGIGLDYLFLSFAPTITWLFVGRILAGISGASVTTASAYIADISPVNKRAENFGLIGVAFGFGFIVGPVIGGLFSQYGIRVPFIIAAGLSMINWLYGYLILPESLDKENRRAFDWRNSNPLHLFKQFSRFPALTGLLVSLLILYVSAQSVNSVWSYFTKLKFDWNETTVGYSIGFAGIMIACVQGGLIRLIIPKLGNKKSILLGLSLYILSFILFAFATEGWMMFGFTLPYALAGITVPAIQGVMSTQVTASEQGELQGINTSLISLANIIGPLLMNFLFYFFTKNSTPVYVPGAPFLLSALLACAAIAVYSYTSKHNHFQEQA